MHGLAENLTRATKERLEQYLSGKVPFEALRHLEVHLGRPKWVLPRAVTEHDGSLLVLGGKRHTTLGRWLGGSTALHTVQTIDVPTFITIPFDKDIERVLVAVDRSYAAGPTIDQAVLLAKLLGARVKIVHVIEPMPDIPSYPLEIESEYHFNQGKEHFANFIEPLLGRAEVDSETLFGPTESTIAQHVTTWKADVLVIGSHGKGWAERLLLGSTTRRLINDLPASLLVVPVRKTES
jgi:nucleotide-binding universal stress UspA family protein